MIFNIDLWNDIYRLETQLVLDIYLNIMKLNIEPRVSKTWDEFCKETPPESIALDGYVLDGPKFDMTTKHINFDHHTFVQRLSTRSTTWQVAMAIKMWIFDVLNPNTTNVYINDADQDVCLSTRLLKNHVRMSGQKSEPLINKLVEIQDKLDCTAGMYPFDPNYDIIQKASWIFDPYIKSRLSNRINYMDMAEMQNIIESVHGRIDKFLLWDAEKKTLDTNYEILWGGDIWRMVKEKWYDARIKMAYDGIKAFVSVKQLENNRYAYSIGKISEFIPFPVQELYNILNEAEWIHPNDKNRRNGWTTIWWSPREGGSTLCPQDIIKIINEYLK